MHFAVLARVRVRKLEVVDQDKAESGDYIRVRLMLGWVIGLDLVGAFGSYRVLVTDEG